MVVVLVNSSVAAVAGFVIVGCGAANVVPQLVSFAAHIKGMAVHNIISFINALGYSGIPRSSTNRIRRETLWFTYIIYRNCCFVLIVAVVSSIILKSKRTISQTDIS